MPTPRIQIADDLAVGGTSPLLVIAGPDMIESDKTSGEIRVTVNGKDRRIPAGQTVKALLGELELAGNTAFEA